MTGEEITTLCRYIRAACPNQAFDEFTPEVWAEMIPQRYTLDECRAAVIAVKQRQPYVDVSDVIAEVKRTRRDAEERGRIRVLLDPAAYRASIAEADARCLALIKAHHQKLLAIEGPQPKRRPEYTGKPQPDLHWTHPRLLAAAQAAQYRRARREDES